MKLLCLESRANIKQTSKENIYPTIWLQGEVFVYLLFILTFIYLQARKSLTLLCFSNLRFSWFRHIIVTLGIQLLIVLLAMYVSSIQNIFGVVGKLIH